MANTSLLFGLTTAFCWGTADYLSRFQSERVGSYKTVVYSHLMTLIILLALVPVLSPSLALPPTATLALLATGLVNFTAFVFLYRAFHRGAISVVAPIAYTYPAVTAVLSVLVLGAVISSARVLAITAVIVGVVLLSTRFSQLAAFIRGTEAKNLTAGVRSAIGASLSFGIVYVGVGYAAPLVSYVIPALFLRTVAVGAGFLLAPLLHQDTRPSRSAFSTTILAMGILEAAGFLIFTYGISTGGGSLPVVAALSGMGGAFAASYGLVFLGERLERNQLIGVALSLTGVFALLYFGG
jgi:uncharacterized membrane protein